jgi:hypothetical protein
MIGNTIKPYENGYKFGEVPPKKTDMSSVKSIMPIVGEKYHILFELD